MGRLLSALVGFLVLALIAAGAWWFVLRDDTGAPDDGWDPDAQFAPSLRPVVGIRITDGDLAVWTGTPCIEVSRISMRLTGDETTRWELSAPDGAPGEVEYLTVGTPLDGFEETVALAEDDDPTAADRALLTLDRDGVSWGTNTDLGVVREESAEHPDDVYYFDGIGWLDAEEVAAGNGEDFLTTCTPDPARE